jgi:hypothetical protein
MRPSVKVEGKGTLKEVNRMTQRISTAVAVLVLLLAWPATGLAQEEAITQARTSAQAWLQLLDKGAYDETWAQAGELLKAAVSQKEWSNKWVVTLGPMGPVEARAVRSAEYETLLPGAPEGEYVVVKFDTTFESKQTALETVTLRRESDGLWRVSGYFIR